MQPNETQINSALTIRRMDLADADLAALSRLAELDSRAELEGPVLGAEIEGRLLAAISVNTGAMVSDPFSRTSELRGLLKLRVDQLRERRSGRRRLGSRRFGRRERAAVGGSPAGQIISLPRAQ